MKATRISVLSALALAATLLVTPAAQAAHPDDSTPCAKRLISAHEGYTAHDDGDTVESQQAAFDIGSNIADSDLWVTKDGYIVEMHDNDVSHSTDGTGLVTQMTLDQVLALRTRHHHEMIPQLNDSLAIPTAHEDGRYLMFETKFSFAKRANLRLLDNEITAAGMNAHVIIYTAYLRHAQNLEKMDPSLTVWFKALDTVPDVNSVLGLDGVMIPAKMLTAEVTAQFQAAGLTVVRERVGNENAAAWKAYVKTGAEALMTADPPTVVDECRALPS